MAGSYRCNHVEYHASNAEIETSRRLSTHCTTMIIGYRSCGVPGCRVEAGYCDKHGGDAMAISVIQTHMKDYCRQHGPAGKVTIPGTART